MQRSDLTPELLLSAFHGYGAPRERWLLGGEFERILVRPDGSPVRYAEPYGIRWILEGLQESEGWKPYNEGENVIELRKDGASITLEPGGQVELSGAPHATVAGLRAEITANRDALVGLCEGRPLRALACGLTPIAPIEDVGWMPKGRYEVMREYLPGDLAHYMMKGTASVQCNYDYSDEADAARKIKLCADVAPLTTAMFANSPLYRGKPTGFLSYRGHVWTRTDPDRTGFPPGLRDDYSHERWVQYLLDVPMMFYKRAGRWERAHGRSFRSYMEQGIDGHFPSMDDWDLHMTSVFPEVRIKRTIEVRGADCVSLPLSVAFCAFFAGLLYDDAALDEGLALAADLQGHGTREDRFDAACREGMRAEIGGMTLGSWAKELAAVARRGLERWAPDEAAALDPLLERVESGRSPAEDTLDAYERDPRPEAIIDSLAY